MLGHSFHTYKIGLLGYRLITGKDFSRFLLSQVLFLNWICHWWCFILTILLNITGVGLLGEELICELALLNLLDLGALNLRECCLISWMQMVDLGIRWVHEIGTLPRMLRRHRISRIVSNFLLLTWKYFWWMHGLADSVESDDRLLTAIKGKSMLVEVWTSFECFIESRWLVVWENFIVLLELFDAFVSFLDIWVWLKSLFLVFCAALLILTILQVYVGARILLWGHECLVLGAFCRWRELLILLNHHLRALLL